MLLANGANVNAQSGFCGTALQAVSSKELLQEGHDKIVEMLLAKGANANARSRRYGTAPQAASSGGHDKIVEMFREGHARS
ncbi:hypothetical protein DL766_007524 [Monosporascus sp. MC13-8B]|nr:hypothetical protein DL766_007524 [Monosporascus sp. MC13-8B]